MTLCWKPIVRLGMATLTLGTALTLPVMADEGKRIDNARVDLHPVPPQTEQAGTSDSGRSQAPGGCKGQVVQADLPFRVTVDGEPLELGKPVSDADRQRCADVALARADIQIRYDDLDIRPALNVWTRVGVVVPDETVTFWVYSNYLAWLKRAELRIFRPGMREDSKPLAVLPVDWNSPIEWRVPAGLEGRVGYVLRVYDAQGRFDETTLKSLEVVPRHRPFREGTEDVRREALMGWGESSLGLRNIPIEGGTVIVSGAKLQEGDRVTALGMQVPMDSRGRFVLRQILPAGPHQVEVRVVRADGRTFDFRRSLSIPSDDWFYVAIGDLTVGHSSVKGPAVEVTGDTQHYDKKTWIDGRGAFYLKGKVKGAWLLTAAADTGNQPLKDLFSNFSDKNPYYLLRNIDPDAYYPVYGDDSTVREDAPTQGKFYVRLEKGDSHVLWGNFKTRWADTELVQYARGLYGAHASYRSQETTSFGARRSKVDAFVADPGSLGARDEFRATGGSLYYLRHMNITRGSEQLWIEVRDKDSGLVLERRALTPAQDYDIDYLQGRVMLREALPSTVDGSGLVHTSALNGNPLYLVGTYEYVPGLDAISDFATGLRVSHWVNDQLQLGLSRYRQGSDGADQEIKGADATYRFGPGTRVRLEWAHSDGSGNGVQTSIDGGFGFDALRSPGGSASAKRVDVAVDLAEVVQGGEGQVAAYWLEKDAGYSAPGQVSLGGEAVRQQGVKASFPMGDNTTIDVKADASHSRLRKTRSAELGWIHEFDTDWTASLGLRRDEQSNGTANASPLLSQNGDRTDLIVRADYRPKAEGQTADAASWSAYGFVQGTVARSGQRSPNNRAGLGGSWHLNDRVSLKAEASGGNLGPGGRLGIDYLVSDRSNAYLNYELESEKPDGYSRGSTGTWVTGADYRISDRARVFGENRISITNGSGPESLTHAFGVDLAPTDRWSYGVKVEKGRISDPLSGDLKRTALALSAGYHHEKTRYAGTLEYRTEDHSSGNDRQVILMRNTLGYQVDPAWRLLGKLNFSFSDNSQGAFYDGDYHELVVGAAYRPVDNDRWNTLLKYTNFYNLPSPGQLTSSDTLPDYAQKSQVFSVDTTFDVRPWLSLGFKYGLRIGRLKDTRGPGEWFSSRADLVILRADWHWVKEWDALVEVRNLRAREAADARAGLLLAVYRHVNEHVKVGIGYNFTDYSDDLTDLDYSSRGLFFNVVGSL
ncbi:MAG: OmpA family protein [Gammaproteobacteria bacterium]|nr:MAG: OmpA family protein [Gammaproteobacteria bacterium]